MHMQEQCGWPRAQMMDTSLERTYSCQPNSVGMADVDTEGSLVGIDSGKRVEQDDDNR